MNIGNIPIRRKLTLIILLTSVASMILMRGAFFTYEYFEFRKTTIRQISTLAEITASNSTAALAFDNQSDAREILLALAAEKNVVAACLYDHDGKIFAKYPDGLAADAFPAAPGPAGFGFGSTYLEGYQPVVQGGNKVLGTLFVRYDTRPITALWIRASFGIAALLIPVILFIAFLMSRALQKQISQPILSLAETAKAISEKQDYSVRAKKLGYDEIGLLTDAFNQMLAQIQELNQALERRVLERTAQLEAANVELDRSRDELRNLFESLPGLYVVLSPDFNIVAASDAYLKATMTTRNAIVGRGIFEVFPDNPDEAGATGESNLRASLERVRGTAMPETMAIQKYDVRRPDGVFEERYWSPINSPVLGADRRVKYIIHRVEEVTDFVKKKSSVPGNESDLRVRMDQMEAEIFQSSQMVQATNRQLESANKELEAFSYSVSHDLRAPLRHIDGFAGLLSKHANAALDDSGKRYLSTISSAAKQMGRLIDDLLAFSRAGRTDLVVALADQDTIVEGAIRDGRFERLGKPIAWRIDKLPRVRADMAMLRQVWSNLIENAVKYSGKVARPRIEIGCKPNTGDGEQVFFVRDNGVGFDMQYVDKLFGVFQRLHTLSEFEGTGIGLANVRRIIARHGGRTWAEGIVGVGATFFFSLPVSAPAKADAPESAASRSA